MSRYILSPLNYSVHSLKSGNSPTFYLSKNISILHILICYWLEVNGDNVILSKKIRSAGIMTMFCRID